MLLVGLTGGIGSGKSTVAARFREHELPVVDADAVAREIVEPGEAALADLAERFGDRILDADGALDRQALADVAFVDDEARAALDAIMHPRIAERIERRLAELRAAGEPIAVVDHPLLVETDTASGYDAVVVVLADEELRVSRLVEQRGLAAEDVRNRLKAQADDVARRAVADHVLVNDGELADLQAQVDRLVEVLRHQAGVASGP